MPTNLTLATAQVAPRDTIEVRYTQASGQPAVVTIIWPAEPTQVSPAKLAEVASVACRVLANSSVELSRLKAGKHR